MAEQLVTTYDRKRALNHAGKQKAKRLGLETLAYPKPAIACERIENAQRQQRMFV